MGVHVHPDHRRTCGRRGGAADVHRHGRLGRPSRRPAGRARRPAGLAVSPAGPCTLRPAGRRPPDFAPARPKRRRPAGRYHLAARIRDELGQILEDVVAVTVDGPPGRGEPGLRRARERDGGAGAGRVPVTPGGPGRAHAAAAQPGRSAVRGEAQLISPYGTWGDPGDELAAGPCDPGLRRARGRDRDDRASRSSRAGRAPAPAASGGPWPGSPASAPDDRADGVREELRDLLDRSSDVVATLRISARRGETATLDREAQPLEQLARELEAFIEAHG